MSKYYWKWELEAKGYKEELKWRDYSDTQLEASAYVEQYLSPSIHYANRICFIIWKSNLVTQ